MTVIYYTCPSYLETAIETIQSIKKLVKLHVFIEVTPDSKSSTIIDIESLDGLGPIEPGEKVLGKADWEKFKPYFDGVASVQFLIHQHKSSFSPASLKASLFFGRHIKNLNPDAVHFDSLTIRVVGLYPYLRSKKTFITVHDPMPHTGEGSWKDKVPQTLFFGRTKTFFFYSEFARQQFIKNYPAVKGKKRAIRFQPITFMRQFLPPAQSGEGAVLFFGRLSEYKGIDILLEAIPKVLQKFPGEKFIIAGSPANGYKIDKETIARYKNNITLIEAYISTPQLVKLIGESKFVVCPYRDATQSGVVMTSFAVGKMVIATNVGSFSEYIEEGKNGMLTEPTAADLAAKICTALEDNKYKQIELNIVPGYSNDTGAINGQAILEGYEN